VPVWAFELSFERSVVAASVEIVFTASFQRTCTKNGTFLLKASNEIFLMSSEVKKRVLDRCGILPP
jgi:hypothetical protein